MTNENKNMTSEKETKTLIKQILDEDNPLPWRTRIWVYFCFFCLALIFASFLLFLVGVVWDFFNKNALEQKSAVTLFLTFFGFAFGAGHLIVKTHDIKKQFKDSYSQRAQQQLTTALGLLYGNKKDANAKSAGVRLLSQLAQDPNYVDSEKIKTSFLMHADLEETKLTNVNLSGFNLQRAILTGSDLRGANLSGANLTFATMKEAILEGADLQRANLFGADLTEAFMTGSDLRGADLTEAKKLDEIFLTGARYNNDTKFPAGFDPEEHGMKPLDENEEGADQ